MKKLLLLVIILITTYGFKKTIFKRGKMYYYESIYIKPNGDTLAVENHTWRPRGRPWLLAPFQQTSVILKYYPDSAKTMNLVPVTPYNRKFREKTLKKYEEKGKEWKGEWRVRVDQGAIENEKEVWIHPKRNDHFAYTEIAPFPFIVKDKLILDSTWNSVMWYSVNNFAGESKELYTVMGQKNYSCKTMELDSCWQINSVGVHSTLGKNYHDFLYHPQHGFVEMKYKFYDGTRIEFYMMEVTDKRK